MKNIGGHRLFYGFTIVELLVVIVVIGILATITIVSYSGVQTRAQVAKINNDLAELSKAIQIARLTNSKVLGQVSGSYYSAGACVAKPAGTDLALLPRSDSCWTRYLTTLSAISSASGINVTNMTDPWGRPYFIDENEGENGSCNRDTIGAYDQPFNGSSRYSGTSINVSLSGFSGCVT